MIVHQIFAHINDGVIKNIIVCDNYELANQLARSIYGNKAIAVECTQYPVSIGDIYKDNTFYFKDGVTPAPRQNTAEEDAMEANAKAAILESQLQQTEISITDNEINDMIRDIQLTDVEITVLKSAGRIGE